MTQNQLLRETCLRADRVTHTPPPENFRSAFSSGSTPDAAARGTRHQNAPRDDLELHSWLGVTRRDLQDMTVLLVAALACVGLLVLGGL